MARVLAAALAFALIGLLGLWAWRQAQLAVAGREGAARRSWRALAAYLAFAVALLALATLLEWGWLQNAAAIGAAPLATLMDGVRGVLHRSVPRELQAVTGWVIALSGLAGFALLHRFVLSRTR